MSIVIFGDLFSFPEGLAATNRVYTYAKGLKEVGVNVQVIVFSNDYKESPDGISDGIPYYHPFGQKRRSRSFFVRRWQKFMKYFRASRLLRKLNREEKIKAINTWTYDLPTYLFAWIHARMLGAKLIIECCEHPLQKFRKGIVVSHKKSSLKFRIETYLSDGILCISRFLVDFYKSRNVSQDKLLMIPSTVDTSRFSLNGSKPLSEPYVGYFGSLTYKRDNVDMLIRGFAMFSGKHPQVRLVLGGFYPQESREQFRELIREVGMEGKVELVDYLTRQEILKYVIHADVLVMTRTNDLDAKASYPSKLTEFLATGKPVVSVNVGEISDFLTDSVNGFLVPPGDHTALAAKLDHIFNNYEKAREVGKKGKELTETVFNYSYQAKRMLKFIDSL